MNWNLKLRGEEPLYRQLQQEIATALKRGRLQPGERLPSVADLAKRLQVSKITVLKAYETLERKGEITSQVGRGTFVTESSEPAARPEGTASVRKLRESYARGLRELLALDRPSGTLNLSSGVAPSDTVPDGLFEKLTESVLSHHPRRLHDYSTQGIPELREAIARRYPGVDPDQVLVTNGSQQALNLLACWALDGDRPIVWEAPTFPAGPGSFQIVGHNLESVPWGTTPPGRAILYLCPDFHNPTGQTLDTTGRRAIADWAQRHDGVVISDEVFRDLRFTGEAPPSLYSMLPPGKRVLIGSLSKTFLSGLRAGYLIADPSILRELLAFRRYMDLGSPTLTQAVAAAFLQDGYDSHLERTRKFYRVRRDAVLGALQALPKGCSWTKPEGGFNLWVTLPRDLSSIQLYMLALERGVAFSPGPAHDMDGRFANCFRLSYGHLTPEQLKEAVGRLVEAVNLLMKQGRSETAASLGIHV